MGRETVSKRTLSVVYLLIHGDRLVVLVSNPGGRASVDVDVRTRQHALGLRSVVGFEIGSGVRGSGSAVQVRSYFYVLVYTSTFVL